MPADWPELNARGAQPQLAAGPAGKGTIMVKNFEDIQKLGKENVEATMTSFSAVSKNAQAIAVEIADYTKKAFEDGTAATEKLIGAKSLDKVIEVQSEYAKKAYEGFVAQSAKLGELYAGLAQEAFKPFESYVAKATMK
jgi:hypothetical protein